MANLDILHFEQLKTEVQAQYLKNNTPSYEEISKWKGIDIIYFQEDLRKKAKGNISEKSFYTYFKNSPVSKLPRIDMLNILCIYVGYSSWHEFKKEHLFAGEQLNETENLEAQQINFEDEEEKNIKTEEKTEDLAIKTPVLQNSNTENQKVKEISSSQNKSDLTTKQKDKNGNKKYLWSGISGLVVVLASFFGLKSILIDKEYTYCFKDIDRTGKIIGNLNITVFKQNESPLTYSIKPGDCFIYSTKDKSIKMSISSPFYENLEINRNLENAPEKETIQLKPDDYKMAVYYFSRKDMTGDTDEQDKLRKQKQSQLNEMISDRAVIYQVYDSNFYGVETMNKQKYITLVTTPTTALKNLSVLEMKKENGKIVSIKFKIGTDEKTQ